MKPTPLLVSASHPLTDDELRVLGEAVTIRCGLVLAPVRLPVAALLPRVLEEVPEAVALAPACAAALLVGLGLATVLAEAPRRDGAARSAVLVVRPSVGGLSDLAGRRVGWVSRSSATGYEVPRLYLESFGVDLQHLFGKERFCGSHHAAAWDLARGDVDVIATHSGRLRGIFGCHPARVIASVGPLPADVIVAGAGVPAPVRTRLTGAMGAQPLGDRVLTPADAGHLRLFESLRRQARDLGGAGAAMSWHAAESAVTR